MHTTSRGSHRTPTSAKSNEASRTTDELWSLAADSFCLTRTLITKNVADLPKPSAYLPDAKYQGKPVHFSYATCGGKDSFSTEVGGWVGGQMLSMMTCQKKKIKHE